MKYVKDPDLSKDSVMDIFVSLFDKLLEHEVHHFKAWILQVSRNHCLMFLRNRKSEIPHELVENTLQDHHENDSTEHEFRLSQLEKHLEHLDEHQRKCLELFYLQKMSYTEVAESTGYTLLQVKSYLQNGKRNLKIRIMADAGRH